MVDLRKKTEDFARMRERIDWIRNECIEEHEDNPDMQNLLNEMSAAEALIFLDKKYDRLGRPSITCCPNGLLSADWDRGDLHLVIRFYGDGTAQMLVSYCMGQFDNPNRMSFQTKIVIEK